MKLLDNVLYLEFNEMVDCLMLEGKSRENVELYLRKAKSVGTKCWHFINDPADKRKVLVGYDELKDQYKQLVQKRFGNPNEYVAKNPIRKLVIKDANAETFFLAYRYDGDKFLSPEHISKYITAASWLNMLIEMNSNKKFIKNELHLSLDSFFKHVTEIINTDSIDLPATYQRLRQRMDQYKAEGYGCLISGKFGNKSAAKIGKTESGFDADLFEKQTAVIRTIASQHNNYDAAQVTVFANTIFEKSGWNIVGPERVRQLMSGMKHITTTGARGGKIFNAEMAMQVKRTRPEYPLRYITMDGWNAELLFQTEDNKYSRLVIVVVLDTMNNYPLGYAIGERENVELIKQANRNALIHINDLFGKPYRPLQLQSDNYGLKALTPFFSAMGHLHTPAAVGNAKAKVIEPYFKYLNKNYCQKQFNWSGFNITSSKKNQPNIEKLNQIKKHLPNKEEVIGQLMIIMDDERKLKIDEYMQQFSKMSIDERMILTKQDMLMLFGKSTGFLNSVTGMGLTPTINGEKLVFDSFDPAFRNNQHLKWQVIYDETDLSSVLVMSEDNKLRMVLNAKRALPMDIESMNADDHHYLSQVVNYKKERREEITQKYLEDATVVAELVDGLPFELSNYNEAALKLMFTDHGQQKEGIQDAKGLKIAKSLKLRNEINNAKQTDENWEALQQSYLTNKSNINSFID